ncbi:MULTISPECIES: ArsR/SmtB family transcription factor [unclassified Sporolactobacillus]|uniref:ArsR/SmtB family transcription factor n=1 Tax=unclassified Sporolactobacillus TaxID=2628533 RepID=UPI002367B32A|nr:metalloregulator ArsR/SmtB family transcription factor [Sporolactobacillus sp. CQH2019]MDD9149143.1 metalloregulator ArsR/SmtB family transcription factor [Sporolactobacillus sp. CQH2019]
MATAKQEHDVFQAIADPTRRKILRLLAEEELPISAITGRFAMSRTAIAKHLRILSEAHLVRGEKIGRKKYYRLRPESFAEVQEWLSYFKQFWSNKLSMLKYQAEHQRATMKIPPTSRRGENH